MIEFYLVIIMEYKSIWKNIDTKTYDEIFSYGEEYKEFLDKSKTEREATAFIENAAVKNGFITLDDALKKGIKKGDKIYQNYKNKAAVLMVVGDDLEKGMNIVGSHIDSPRLDLKQNPLYEDTNMAFFKTHYYGGIKKYQWPTIQLSLHGFFIDSNGEKKNISIGENEDEPVFFINDLLPHLGKDQISKKASDVVPGEALNILVGHSDFDTKDDEKDAVKNSILKILKDKYNLEEEDFQFAEFEIVPAAHARDVGFDRSMIAAHGQDDRICSFANLKAILEIENPTKSAVGLFVDKEEIGSVGNTSMSAKFFENFVSEVINSMGDYSELKVKRAIANSKVLSADVSAAIDPEHKNVHDIKNAPTMGHGITITKFTGARGKSGSNDANSEYLYEIRDLFHKNNIIYQTGELGAVDQGGGGTIAYILAEYGADVVDMGPAMLSMHAPIELTSKADAYMSYRAYKVFMDR